MRQTESPREPEAGAHEVSLPQILTRFDDLREFHRLGALIARELAQVVSALLQDDVAVEGPASDLPPPAKAAALVMATRAQSLVAELRRITPDVCRPASVIVEIGTEPHRCLDLLRKRLIWPEAGRDYLAGEPAKAALVPRIAFESSMAEFTALLTRLAQQRVLDPLRISDLNHSDADDAEWREKHGVIGEDQRLVGACRLVRIAARRAANWPSGGQASSPMPPPLLLRGETGTGKGLIAKLAHASFQGARGGGDVPFVTINCATLSPELAAVALFGHAKGAFTGADKARDGLLAEADGGVVFLDEIHRLPREAQGALLRYLETGILEVVGAPFARWRQTCVFVVAAVLELPDHAIGGAALPTGAGLPDDLFQRLASPVVTIPPLRERPADDIASMIEHLEKQHGLPAGAAFTPYELKGLTGYDWPRNVRELRDAVANRALVFHHTGPRCTLCGVPGHTHGQVVPSHLRAAAVEAATRRAGKFLSREQIGRHLCLTGTQVKELRKGHSYRGGRKPKPRGDKDVPCKTCLESAPQ